jgi:Na+-translocating ferredoxin:NAD+ oxidoreductase RnfE subunit
LLVIVLGVAPAVGATLGVTAAAAALAAVALAFAITRPEMLVVTVEKVSPSATMLPTLSMVLAAFVLIFPFSLEFIRGTAFRIANNTRDPT